MKRHWALKVFFKFRNDKNEVLMNHLRLEKYQNL